MFKKVAILLLTIFVVACSTEDKAMIVETGTLNGQILWLEGDVMPGIGIGMPAAQGVQRDVYIVPAVKESDMVAVSPIFFNLTSDDYQLVTTDENGEFMVSLPVGHYSVFVDEGDEGLFSNRADGEGYLTPVTIESGHSTDITIQVDYKAYH